MPTRCSQFFDQSAGGFLGYLNLFSGGNFRRLTIFALGIMPYITASIILQLLTVVYEPLAKLQKEGELGRKKITQWTRYLTVLLASLQSFVIAITCSTPPAACNWSLNPGTASSLMTMLTLTAGSAFIMWLGEQITERGIGNGMSLLIFAGIVVGLPRGIADLWDKVQTSAWGALHSLRHHPACLRVMLAVVAFIVFVERSERRIPVQYAKRIVGRKMMGGQSTIMPLRVNSGGVMPVIFASSILSFPHDRAGAVAQEQPLLRPPSSAPSAYGEPLYTLLYCAGHHLLRILLRLHCLQPGRCRRQHAQVRRLYPRHPSRRAHRELHQRRSLRASRWSARCT